MNQQKTNHKKEKQQETTNHQKGKQQEKSKTTNPFGFRGRANRWYEKCIRAGHSPAEANRTVTKGMIKRNKDLLRKYCERNKTDDKTQKFLTRYVEQGFNVTEAVNKMLDDHADLFDNGSKSQNNVPQRQTFGYSNNLERNFDMPQTSREHYNFNMPKTSREHYNFNMPETSRLHSNFDMPQTSRSLDNADMLQRKRSNNNFNMPQSNRSRNNFEMPQTSRSHNNFDMPQTSRSHNNFDIPQSNRSHSNFFMPQTNESYINSDIRQSVERQHNFDMSQASSFKGQQENNFGNNTNKRMRDMETHHYSNSTRKIVRVAVLPENYPHEILNTNQLHTLENAILEEVALGWETELLFHGINFGSGMLFVDCKNSDTIRWLYYVVPQLHNWRGMQLIACLEDDLPKPHTAPQLWR